MRSASADDVDQQALTGRVAEWMAASFRRAFVAA
jgi:hypothetical protein